MSSNNFFINIFTYIKMSKNSSANIIKKIKKDYKKNFAKDIKVFLKKKKGKRNNMVVNDTKISQKMKN